MINKVCPHITQNEDLLFERSSPGKKGYQLPALDVPPVDAAAATGEWTGTLRTPALLKKRGTPRRKALTPDSAHGTNPATAATAGYGVENIRSNNRGMVDLAELERVVDKDVAALMVTNPNTLGLFEANIKSIAEILHKKGALLYMDGAN